MPLDPAARAIVELMQEHVPRIDIDTDAEDLRLRMRQLMRLPPAEECASIQDRTIPGPAGALPVRVYRPVRTGRPIAADETVPGFVYFHGGGWVICDLDSHEGACRRLANAVGAVVVSVDYRLAPEHPWPAASDDAYAATCWVADHASELGIDPRRLAVAGDSAGGNLTAVVALMARDRGRPPLAFQLMIYPVIDSTTARHDYASRHENAEGNFLTTAHMEWYRAQYLPDDERAGDPYASPICAVSLAGLPPACVVTAEMDPLRDEGERYAALLAEAGVPVTTHRALGMFHGFFNMDAVLDAAKDAQHVAFDAARDALGTMEGR